MNQQEYCQAIDWVIYLSACAVNDIVPDREKVSKMNLEQLYKAADDHMMTAVVCYALESAGIKDHAFIQAKFKSIRKVSAMELDLLSIAEQFEREKIWYVPLKGCVIKDYYPSIGLRQMSDFDLLFDETKADKVKTIMEQLGFTCDEFGETHHDVYFKQPVSNFEMHRSLFSEFRTDLYKYYKDVFPKLIKDDDKNYGYHFSDEDLYVYLTAHEYKHYSKNGVGLRLLLDCYVFMNAKQDSLDRDNINKQTKKLGISDFERRRRELAMKVFSCENQTDLTEQEKQMLTEYSSIGVYGSFENGIKNQLKNQSKFSFWVRNIFIPYKRMVKSVPFTRKSILLYPVGFVWRCGRMLFSERRVLVRTIKAVNKYGRKT